MARHLLFLAGAFATLWCTSTARADIVPSGYKSVKLSIEVATDEGLPEGQTLLLINTWEGATELPPGKTVQVQWHPLHGRMQVVSVTASQRKAIDAIAEKHRGPERFPKMQKRSTACADPFDGVRTVEDTEDYDEIRWHYAVAFEGEDCKGDLTRTVYLDEDGETVKQSSSGEPKAAPAKAPTAKPASRKASSTCSVSEPGDAAPRFTATLLALLAGLALGRRRGGPRGSLGPW